MEELVTMDQQGRITLVRCHGELDLLVRDDLRAALTALVVPGVQIIVVDLGDVTFLDCTGLGALIALARECAEHDVRLLLAAVPRVGRQLLEALDLVSVFVTVPTAEDAISLAESWVELGPDPNAQTSPFLPSSRETCSVDQDRNAP